MKASYPLISTNITRKSEWKESMLLSEEFIKMNGNAVMEHERESQ